MRFFASVFLWYVIGSVAELGLTNYQAGELHARFLVFGGGAILFLLATFMLLRRPWNLDNFLRRLVLTGFCFYAGIALCLLAQRQAVEPKPSVAIMVVALLCFQGAALVLVRDVLRSSGTNWVEAFGLGRNTGRAIVYGVMAASIFLPIGWALQFGSTEILKFVPGGKPVEQEAVQVLRTATTLGDRVISGLATIVLAPIAEELLFRGILFTWIRQLGYERTALWFTSIFFAALHYNRATFVPLVLLAIILAKLYERTGNLLASIAAHSFFNTLNFTLLFIQESAWRP